MTINPQVKDPTWKMVMWYIFGVVLIILIALMSSCGARKVNTTINKSTESDSEKVTDKNTSIGSVVKTNVSQDSTITRIQNAKVDEAQNKKVTELFNENGTLKERITELLNSKSTDNSTIDQKSGKTIHINTDSIFNNNHYTTRDINHYYTTYAKGKKTETNNDALYWMLGGVLGLVVAGFFVYKYVTKKVVPIKL